MSLYKLLSTDADFQKLTEEQRIKVASNLGSDRKKLGKFLTSTEGFKEDFSRLTQEQQERVLDNLYSKPNVQDASWGETLASAIKSAIPHIKHGFGGIAQAAGNALMENKDTMFSIQDKAYKSLIEQETDNYLDNTSKAVGKRVSAKGKAISDKALDDVENLMPSGHMTEPQQFVHSTAGSIAQNIPYIAASAITRKPIGLAGMGVQAGGSGYDDAARAGYNHSEALRHGATTGGIEVVTEKIPFDRILKPLTKYAKLGDNQAIEILKTMGYDAAGEATAEAAGIVEDARLKNNNITFGEALNLLTTDDAKKQILLAGLSGVVASGMLQTGTIGLGKLADRDKTIKTKDLLNETTGNTQPETEAQKNDTPDSAPAEADAETYSAAEAELDEFIKPVENVKDVRVKDLLTGEQENEASAYAVESPVINKDAEAMPVYQSVENVQTQEITAPESEAIQQATTVENSAVDAEPVLEQSINIPENTETIPQVGENDTNSSAEPVGQSTQTIQDNAQEIQNPYEAEGYFVTAKPFNGETKYFVTTPKEPKGNYFYNTAQEAQDHIEQSRKVDVANAEYAAQQKPIQEAKIAREEALNNFNGFTDDMNPMQIGKVKKALYRNFNDKETNKEHVERLVNEGWTIKNGDLLSPDGGKSLNSKYFGNTVINYAKHLVAQKESAAEQAEYDALPQADKDAIDGLFGKKNGADAVATNQTAQPVQHLYTEDISDKAFVVKGRTQETKDVWKQGGGKWNPKYKGWMFPKSKQADVDERVTFYNKKLDEFDPANKEQTKIENKFNAGDPIVLADGRTAKVNKHVGNFVEIDKSQQQRNYGMYDVTFSDGTRGSIADYQAVKEKPRDNKIIVGYIGDKTGKEAEAVKTAIKDKIDEKISESARDYNKPIGKNIDGDDVYEDEQGVRSVASGNYKVTESVGVTPGKGITVKTLDKRIADKDYRHLTADEVKAADIMPEWKKPKDDVKSDYGAKNKVFTKDKADEARAKLREKLNQLNSGIDPEMLAYGIQIAGYHIEAGARSFTEYSKAMITDFGEKIRPYLRSFYEGVRHYPEFDNAGMTASEDISEQTENKPGSKNKKLGTFENMNTAELSTILLEEINKGTVFSTQSFRAFIRDVYGVNNQDGLNYKNAEEAYEYAVVQKAREISRSKLTDAEKWEAIKSLYNNQVNLNTRTATSVENQQYSTPAPIAYLMGKYINADKGYVYEPTAGNGMLTIVANPATTTVNELDDGARLNNLNDTGFDWVANEDALTFFDNHRAYEGKFDSVIMNPPFGSVEPKKYDGYPVNKLEHRIILESLRGMKDDGSAAFIIGGHNFDKDGNMSKADRMFFNYLYSNYNVTKNIDVNGEVYTKQGTKFPIRVIIVEGWREEAVDIYAPTSREQVQYAKDLDALHDILGENNERRDGYNTETRHSGGLSGRNDKRLREGRQEAGSEGRGSDNDRVRGHEPVVGRQRNTDKQSGPDSVSVDGERSDKRKVRVDDDIQRRRGVEGGGRNSGLSAVSLEKEHTTDLQVIYKPFSKGNTGENQIPSTLFDSAVKALNDIQSRRGDIDTFVMDELQYKSKEQLYKALSAEQIDSVAMALDNILNGKGMIIGDQTGVGKGRMAASIIRWANLNGMKPIFMTQQPKLFTDMYNDLADIGHTEFKPFIAHKETTSSIVDSLGNIIVKSASEKQLNQAASNPFAFMEDYDAIFLPYTSVRKPNKHRQILNALSRGNIVILDEAHEAGGGESNTGLYIREMIQDAKGVLYLSATYAKRPDVMPLYYKTDLGSGGMSIESLISAMDNGGVMLQQYVAKMLADTGQYIRREMSFDGIKFSSVTADTDSVKTERMADEITKCLSEIVALDSSELKKSAISVISEEHGITGGMAKTREDVSASVGTANFASIVHNYVKQMLLSVKLDGTISTAIDELKKGNKVVISLQNTLEQSFKDMIGDSGVAVGHKIPDSVNFKYVIKNALKAITRYKHTDRHGKETTANFDIERFPAFAGEYRRIEAMIDAAEIDFPASPIDYIKHNIAKAGYSITEITGRTDGIEYQPDGSMVYVKRGNEDKNKNTAVNGFNNGTYDAILINESGSTGLSIHASEKFKDKRKRVMVVAQPHLDINKFVQTLGRIFRKGQVVKPEYILMQSSIPAEIRPVIVLNRKMSSMSANTTADSKSSMDFSDIPDMMNDYGDEIVRQYLIENPEIEKLTGVDSKKATFVQVSGKVGLLPVKMQRKFYDDISREYTDLIEYLSEIGENKLEKKTEDFEAVTASKTVRMKGQDESKPFSSSVYLEKLSVKVQKKPFALKEIKEKSDTNLEKIKDNSDIRNLKTNYSLFIDDEKTDFMNVHKDDEEKSVKWVNRKDKFDYVQNKTSEMMRKIRFGQTVMFTVNDTAEKGIVLDLKYKYDTGNPYSPSKFKLVVALPDSRQTMTIPLSKLNDITPYNFDWEKSISRDARETRYVLTGNLLEGAGLMKGQLVDFTRDDGTTELGILIPRSSHDDIKRSENNVRTSDAKDAYGELERAKTLRSSNGDMTIIFKDSHYQLSVPRSKQSGGKYFLDKDLQGMMSDEFHTVSQYMVAKIKTGREKDVVKYLTEKHGLSYDIDSRHIDTVKEKPEFRLNTAGRADNVKHEEGKITPDTRKLENAIERSLGRTVQGYGIQPVQSGENGNSVPSGWIRSHEVRNTDSGELVGKLSKTFGKRVVYFTNSRPDIIDIDGVSFGDTIYINANAKNPALVIFGHELNHQLKKDMPETYDNMRQELVKMLSVDAVKKYGGKLKGFKESKNNDLIDEMIGDLVGDNFAEPKFWQELSKRLPESFKKIADAVTAFIDKVLKRLKVRNLGSSEIFKDIVRARKVVADAYAEYLETYSGQNNGFENYIDEIHKLFAGEKISPIVKIGTTPDILLKLGAEQLPMQMYVHKIKQTIKKHGLEQWIYEELPFSLENTVAVFDSATEPNSLVVLTEMVHNGKPVLAALHLKVKDRRHTVNLVASVYGKDKISAINSWVKDGKLIYSDKIKSLAFKSMGLQLPSDGTYEAKNNIETESDSVNVQLKDEPLFLRNNPEDDKLSNYKDIEERFNQSEGLKDSRALKSTIKQAMIKIINDFRRHFPNLDYSKHAEIANLLRVHKSTPERAKMFAADILNKITKDFDKQELKVFSRFLILRDILSEFDKGRYYDGNAPFGYENREQVEADFDKVNGIVQSSEKIKEAVKARTDIVNKFKQALVNYDLLPESVMDSDTYYRHQVLRYMNLSDDKYSGKPGLSSNDVRNKQKGFQKGRTGSDLDFNTNYLESEFEWMSQGFAQLETKKVLMRVQAMHDKSTELRAKAKKESEETGEPVDWRKYVGKDEYSDYEIWQPEKGNHFYGVLTIQEKQLDQLLKGMIGIEDAKIAQALAVGARKEEWVIPSDIAKTLNDFRQMKEEPLLVDLYRKSIGSWKIWTLLNPLRLIKYNLNNMTGDLDIVLAYNPKILKHVGRAAKELYTYNKSGDAGKMLREAIAQNVIGSGMSIAEIPDINGIAMFARFADKKSTQAITKYWDTVKGGTNFRENLLRYAAYIHFREQGMQGKTDIYAASSKKEIRQIHDPVEKAAKLSRDLLGDYGNISHAGMWLRTHIMPFYSWVEINLPRYARLLKNMPDEGGNAGVVRTVTVKAGSLALKAGIFAGMVMLWNAAFFEDEDEELRRSGNRQLHLILGRREDGSIRTLRMQGALSDALSWFGMEDISGDVRDLHEGKATVKDKMLDGAKAPIQKIFDSSLPIIKTIGETTAGWTTYPDIANPRPILDKAEHVARLFSLDMFYRHIAGLPTRDSSAEMWNLIGYSKDPEEGYYYQSKKLVNKYRESIGKDRQDVRPSDKGKKLIYMKRAMKYGDKKAFEKYLLEYAKEYKTVAEFARHLKQSIEMSAPLGGLSRRERRVFLDSLKPKDREIIEKAERWYDELNNNYINEIDWNKIRSEIGRDN